ELHDCVSLSENALREHLELELATLELTQVVAELAIRCRAEVVTIALTRRSGSRFPVEVRVDLRDTARAARERLIALAATELLAQAERARAAHAAQREQPVERSAVSIAQSVRVRESGSATAQHAGRRRTELFLAGSLSLDGAPKTALWGGSLGAMLGLGRSWSLLLDTRFERGQTQAELATVRWSSLSGFAGPSVRIEVGLLRAMWGFGVRAGWLVLSADARAPHEGRSLTAPWVGLALPVRLGAELATGVVPFLGAEAGYVLLPVRGNVSDGASLTEHRGLWLAGTIGVAVRL
ncbi:MAG TPA: hypothetical protein VEX18_04400, partial [Polyangiaceae bacterium]|nr:hypothetical protein [Polyangiaceae bacterium]